MHRDLGVTAPRDHELVHSAEAPEVPPTPIAQLRALRDRRRGYRAEQQQEVA